MVVDSDQCFYTDPYYLFPLIFDFNKQPGKQFDYCIVVRSTLVPYTYMATMVISFFSGSGFIVRDIRQSNIHHTTPRLPAGGDGTV